MKLIDVEQTFLLEHPASDEYLDSFLDAGWRIVETVKHQTRAKNGTVSDTVEFLLGAKKGAKKPRDYRQYRKNAQDAARAA